MFKKIQKIHFVGIGGSGMNGIAELLLNLGYKISGSDMKESDVTRRLADMGARICIGHIASNLGESQVVVTSTAVQRDNPEVVEAKRRNIPVIPRIEMLAELARMKYAVTIAGTHGKTTTTSLASLVLQAGGLDPTAVIGGRLQNLGSNARLGKGDYLVAEADESDGSFLKLSPTIAVITNIDNDHLDYWKTMKALDRGFGDYANRVPFYGAVVACGDDPGVQRVLPSIRRPVITYGLSEGAELRAVRIRAGKDGSFAFDVMSRGRELGTICWNVPGRHNILNALAAVAVGLELNIPFSTIAEALSSFRGVGRRMEWKGEAGGITVIDDYGHHPAEIRATLQALKERWPDRRRVVLFQPHRYSRTKLLGKEFADSFGDASKVFLMDIYGAGEKPVAGVSSRALAGLMKRKKVPVTWAPSRELFETLRRSRRPGDVLLTLGAGDVCKWGPFFLQAVELEEFASNIRFQEPLSLHTSFRIGGPADFLIDIDRAESLRRLAVWSAARSVPVFFIGQGSNLLVGDKGIRGVVARLKGDFEEVRLEGDRVWAGAGVPLPLLARRCAENGLEGIEFLAGVPGTVGGALMTNAGTAAGRIGDWIETVEIVTPDGKMETLGKKDLVFAYRSSNVQGRWVSRVGLKLRRGDKNDSMKKIRKQFEGRSRTQPWGTHNAGCIFKNPPEGPAGRLIEQAGLKGRRIGDAEVSAVHANFIINRGKATARDVRGLIDEVRKKVRDRFRVELELEVRLAGE